MESVAKSTKWHFVAFVTILFASFAFNFFGVGAKDWYVNYQKDSDALVLNTLACSDQAGVLGGWLKGQAETNISYFNPSCNKNLKPYYSQIGAQGRAYTILFKLLNSLHVSKSIFILLMKIANSFLSALVIALFSLWVLRKFGVSQAYITTFLIANSPWVVGFSKSFYWALPLIILPILLPLLLIKKKMTRRENIVLFLAIFFALVVKFSTGYEYTSTIILGVIASTSVVLILNNERKKRVYGYFLTIIGVGLIAFFATITIHISLVSKDVGSLAAAKLIIKDRILERTSDGGNFKKYVYGGVEATIPEVRPIINYYVPLDQYGTTVPRLKTEIVSIINYAFLPVISIPVQLKQPLESYLSSLAMLVTFILFIERKVIKKIVKNKKIPKDNLNESALLVGALIGLIGILSWYVLAHGHSYVHAHINGITFYLPFALFAYVIVAIKLVNASKILLKKIRSDADAKL